MEHRPNVLRESIDREDLVFREFPIRGVVLGLHWQFRAANALAD